MLKQPLKAPAVRQTLGFQQRAPHTVCDLPSHILIASSKLFSAEVLGDDGGAVVEGEECGETMVVLRLDGG